MLKLGLKETQETFSRWISTRILFKLAFRLQRYQQQGKWDVLITWICKFIKTSADKQRREKVISNGIKARESKSTEQYDWKLNSTGVDFDWAP